MRSEGLLPDDEANPAPEIAEEVSLDLQADSTRQVGAPPADTPVSKPAEAIAEALRPAGPRQPTKDQLDERLPPPQ